jgi:GntR family transcriptional regulator
MSTIKRAIAALVSDHLLDRTPGRGTFVTRPQSAGTEVPLRSFHEEMRARGLTPGSKVLTKEIIQADGELAWQLDLPEGSDVYFVRSLKTAESVPVALEEAYVPCASCPGLFDHDLEVYPIERLLEDRYRLAILKALEYVHARPATPEESALLDARDEQLILIVADRTVEGIGRQRVEYSRTLYRADRYILRFHLRRFAGASEERGELA